MLCVEDYIDALDWAASVGGLDGLIARADANLSVIEAFVGAKAVARVPGARRRRRDRTLRCASPSPIRWSPRSTRMARRAFAKGIVAALEKEGVAFDIGHYRDAPAGLRIWTGATVEKSDLEALMPWIEWAFDSTEGRAQAGRLILLAGGAIRRPFPSIPLFIEEASWRPRVLVSDALSETAVEIFRRHGVEVDYLPDLGKDKDKLARSSAIMTAWRSVPPPRSRKRLIGAAQSPEGDRACRHRCRQCRYPGRKPQGHHRDEHALRQFDHDGRTCHRADVRGRPPDSAGRSLDAGRQVGKEPLHGRRDHRQDARPHRLRQYRLHRRYARRAA